MLKCSINSGLLLAFPLSQKSGTTGRLRDTNSSFKAVLESISLSNFKNLVSMIKKYYYWYYEKVVLLADSVTQTVVLKLFLYLFLCHVVKVWFKWSIKLSIGSLF